MFISPFGVYFLLCIIVCKIVSYDLSIQHLYFKAQHFYSTISNKIKKRMQHRAIVQHISQRFLLLIHMFNLAVYLTFYRYTNASDEDLLKNDLW